MDSPRATNRCRCFEQLGWIAEQDKMKGLPTIESVEGDSVSEPTLAAQIRETD